MRKWKKLRLSIIFVLAVVLCGCKEKNEVEKEVDFDFFTQTDDYDTNDDHEGSNSQEKSEEGTESIEHYQSEIREKNENAILELTNLSESMDFTGAEGELVIEPTGNSFENNKALSDLSYLVCYDEENQCSYYINYGIDDYIYQRKGNETTLLIQETARYLLLWENRLYFVHASGMFMTGDIFCYDLSSKQLTTVIEGENDYLYVDEDGMIFGRCEIDEQEGSAAIDWMMLNHNSTIPTRCDAIKAYKYENFVVQSNLLTKQIELKNCKTGEVDSLFPNDYMTNYRVYGSYVIVRKYAAFLVIDLSTGEKTIYDVTQCDIPDKYFAIRDYIVKEHTMYIAPSVSNYMITLDLETGTISCLENEIELYQVMDALYIAGDKMYAYLNMMNNQGTMFVEVSVSDHNYCYE